MPRGERERPSGGHSEYMEGIDRARLESLAEAITRWNQGDRGNCGCPTCSGRIRDNILNDTNRILNNLREDYRIGYEARSRQIVLVPESDGEEAA